MALIALVTANRVKVVESIIQRTLVAGEAIVAGAPVRIDTNGHWLNALGTTAPNGRAYGVATKTVAAGEGLTAIKKGLMDGWDLSGAAYDAPIYVSDTSGRLGDAAGTVTVIVGRVYPGQYTNIGVAFDKILDVDL